MNYTSNGLILVSKLVILVYVFLIVSSNEILPDEQRLLRKLFNDQSYDNSVRPVFNSSDSVMVSFGFTLIQIMDMDEKNQILITNAWLEHQWKDERISWNKDDYNGLEVIRLPAKKLWLPDIVLYNNADDFTTGFMSCNAMVHSNGIVFWSPPARLRSSCKVDITYFPFDNQKCKLKFGSWTYDKAQVDLTNKSQQVDVSAYITNGEWKLSKYEIVRNEVVYPISDAIYPDVTVILVIERRILYYILNILFPCFWLNFLSVLTFCLPPDAGEKITLSITVLLSYSVFMLLVAESMPPTSEFIPLIGIYLTVSMAVASISVILTVFVLKLHHCSPNQTKVPGWVKFLVLKLLGTVVLCRCMPEKRSRRKKKVGCSVKQRHANEPAEMCMKLMSDTLNKPNYRLTPDSLATTDIHCNMTGEYTGSSNDRNEYRRRLNLNSDDSTRDILYHERKLTGMEDVLKYLKVMVGKSDAEDDENCIVDEWKQVALVIDRLLFWSFLAITILSTLVLLVVIPGIRRFQTEGL